MRDIKYNGEQYLDLLRSINLELWEQVLDLIADHHTELQLNSTEQNIDGGSYCHTYDDKGNIILEWGE